jgi:hypothetical protein
MTKHPQTDTPQTDTRHSGSGHADRGQSRGGVAQRLDASLVPSIRGVRISPNESPARLVNISSAGVLVECEHRYNPGGSVTVRFTGTFRPASVPGRVARATVAGVGASGALNYHIGIAFVSPITMPEPATPPSAPGRDIPRAVTPSSPPEPVTGPPSARADRRRQGRRNNW